MKLIDDLQTRPFVKNLRELYEKGNGLAINLIDGEQEGITYKMEGGGAERLMEDNIASGKLNPSRSHMEQPNDISDNYRFIKSDIKKAFNLKYPIEWNAMRDVAFNKLFSENQYTQEMQEQIKRGIIISSHAFDHNNNTRTNSKGWRLNGYRAANLIEQVTNQSRYSFNYLEIQQIEKLKPQLIDQMEKKGIIEYSWLAEQGCFMYLCCCYYYYYYCCCCY